MSIKVAWPVNGSLFSAEVPIEMSSSPVSLKASTEKAARSTVNGGTGFDPSRIPNCSKASLPGSETAAVWIVSTIRGGSGGTWSVTRD